MKHNYIFDSSRTYHDQHMLPISPQNFDPLDKSKDTSSQKKGIFSGTTKLKTSYEPIFEVENSQIKIEDLSGETEIKKMLAKEIRTYLDNLKTELLASFSAFLRDDRNSGRISNEEIQEVKRQIIYNKNRFEEIQEHIIQVSQQYSDITSLYTRELESLKSSVSLSGLSKSDKSIDLSMSGEFTQKQLDQQFKNFKNELVGEIQNAIKIKSKSKLNDDVVGELRQIKHSFESDLKQNFEMINGRVKRAEENLNEVMRKKRDYMDAIRDEFTTSIDHQNTALNQEIKHLESQIKSKCEQTQAKALVSTEINKRIEFFRTEVEALRKANESNQEEMERVNTFVTRKLEGLDYDMKKQFFEFQTSLQKSNGSQQSPDLLEKRIQILNADSEKHYNTLQQLRAQIEEVNKVHKVLQNQASTPSSQQIINRLQEKIAGLQNQVEILEMQVRKNEATKKAVSNDSLKKLSADNLYVQQSETSYDQQNAFDSSADQIKYYGDPKVKSIIDEFHQKRKQVKGSPNDPNEKSFQLNNSLSAQKYNGNSQSSQLTTNYNTDKAGRISTVQEYASKGDPTQLKSQEEQAKGTKNIKQLHHAKILAQINYFIDGTVSNLLDDEEDSEIYCNLDDDGYIFDEDGDFVLDSQGNKVKLSHEQIEKFNNNNMIE